MIDGEAAPGHPAGEMVAHLAEVFAQVAGDGFGRVE
jgi:hypothetical protein